MGRVEPKFDPSMQSTIVVGLGQLGEVSQGFGWFWTVGILIRHWSVVLFHSFDPIVRILSIGMAMVTEFSIGLWYLDMFVEVNKYRIWSCQS